MSCEMGCEMHTMRYWNINWGDTRLCEVCVGTTMVVREGEARLLLICNESDIAGEQPRYFKGSDEGPDDRDEGGER